MLLYYPLSENGAIIYPIIVMQEDKFKIDSHKLMYHPHLVARWQSAGHDWEQLKKIYPLYVEISPAGQCNHRCTFCAVDYIGYQKQFLPKETLKQTLTELAALKLRSVMFAGEGEPLLMKDLAECITHGKSENIDIGITTNAVPMTRKFVETALDSLVWIKVSINGGDPQTYAKTHRTHAKDFQRVIDNLKFAVQYRRENQIQTTLGAQAVLIQENMHSIVELCQQIKEIGLDYFVVKPYSQHLKSLNRQVFNYEKTEELAEKLQQCTSDSFQVIFRKRTMESLAKPKRYYQKCYATPFFWAYIMASGDVYGCSAHLLDKKFCYGNIKEETFAEIWESNARKENYSFMMNKMNISNCRKNCRMEHVNRYLWDLQNPVDHVNFI